MVAVYTPTRVSSLPLLRLVPRAVSPLENNKANTSCFLFSVIPDDCSTPLNFQLTVSHSGLTVE